MMNRNTFLAAALALGLQTGAAFAQQPVLTTQKEDEKTSRGSVFTVRRCG
jgi:hypothetical protein